MKLLLGAGVCAALVAGTLCGTAPIAMACPSGTVQSDFSGVCVSGQSGQQTVTGGVSAPGTGAVISGGPNSLPSVDGIPCTPQHLGTCIGLAQSQG